MAKKTDSIGRCGYRCKICPAYRDNITGKGHQQKVSDGWFKIYGFRVPAEQVICDGCLAEDADNPRRIDTQCPVRPCVIEKGIPNCAHCDKYICKKLQKRIVEPDEVMKKCKKHITQQEYDSYIKPYDNKTTLDNIRKDLRNG